MSNILTNNINPRSGNLITIGGANDRVSIAGTLSYEDVTNIDSVGIITAQSGIKVPGGSVAIGLDTTQALLHVKSSVARASIVESTSTDGSYTSFVDPGTSSYDRVQIGSAGNDLVLRTTEVERVRIDSSGNVGIGTINPGGSQSALLHVVHSGACPFTIDGTSAGGGYLTIENNGSARYFIGSGAQLGGGTVSELALRSQTGGGITFLTNGANERARIDSSGRLLVGTSSAPSDTGNGAYYSKLVSVGNLASSTGDGRLALCRGTTASSLSSGNGIGEIHFADSAGGGFAMISAFADGTPGANDYPGRLVFSTTADGASSPTERMKIANNGTSFFQSNENVIGAMSAIAAGTAVRLYYGSYSAANFAGTVCYTVWTNGDVVNANNSYGSLSDIKLKENIVDANSQWNDIKDIRVRNYNFIEGQTHTQIGVVAQEVETVSPGLVYESPDLDNDGNDLGTVTKSVNYSVLYMKAVKALQEAMERIETLEQRLTDAGL